MHTRKREIFTDPTAAALTRPPDARSSPIRSPKATTAIMQLSAKQSLMAA